MRDNCQRLLERRMIEYQILEIQGADFKLSPVHIGTWRVPYAYTGQNEISLEPHSPQKEFEISHA